MRSAALIALFALGNLAQAQQSIIRLYPGTAPGSEGWTQKEVQTLIPQLGGEVVRNVVEPTMTVFPPPAGTANGTAIIVCPGGGFQFLSWTNEGTAVAEWLNKMGITVFLLKYRVADTGTTNAEFGQRVREMFQALMTDFKAEAARLAPAAIPAEADGRRAVEVVRQNAAKWNVMPDRIGIIGFSAGATVAIHATANDNEVSRPNFTASIYGSEPRAGTIPKDAPPLFLLCASDDLLVPPSGSVNAYTAWTSAGHSAELHVFNKGGHGFGMAKHGLPVDHWTDLMEQWLRSLEKTWTGAVRWSPALKLDSQSQIDSRLALPFGDEFQGTTDGAKAMISNCNDYLRLSAKNFHPDSGQDAAILHNHAVDCVALDLLRAARAPRTDLLSSFQLNADSLNVLPPELAPAVSNEIIAKAKAADAAGESWKTFAPEAVAKTLAHEQIEVTQAEWKTDVSVYAHGDFSGTGSEELLVRADYKALHGTYGNSQLFLLARGETDLKRLRLVRTVSVP